MSPLSHASQILPARAHSVPDRTRNAAPRASFDRDELRVFEFSLSPGTEELELPAYSRDDALLFVHGGTAMVGEPHGPLRLLDPAHALLARSPRRIGIQVHSAHTRCTLLVLSGTEALPLAMTGEHAQRPYSVVPLSVDPLLRLFWLRRAVARGTSRSSMDISRVARGILWSVASTASVPATPVEGGRSRAQRRALANGARMRLAASVEQSHRLVDVARAVHASPFHLAHVFREEVGYSLHQYLVRLRLIAALDRLSVGASDLSALALDLGFSNHSHFSEAFRRAFGIVPSEARRRLSLATFADDGLPWPDAIARIPARCG